MEEGPRLSAGSVSEPEMGYTESILAGLSPNMRKAKRNTDWFELVRGLPLKPLQHLEHVLLS